MMKSRIPTWTDRIYKGPIPELVLRMAVTNLRHIYQHRGLGKNVYPTGSKTETIEKFGKMNDARVAFGRALTIVIQEVLPGVGEWTPEGYQYVIEKLADYSRDTKGRSFSTSTLHRYYCYVNYLTDEEREQMYVRDRLTFRWFADNQCRRLWREHVKKWLYHYRREDYDKYRKQLEQQEGRVSSRPADVEEVVAGPSFTPPKKKVEPQHGRVAYPIAISEDKDTESHGDPSVVKENSGALDEMGVAIESSLGELGNDIALLEEDIKDCSRTGKSPWELIRIHANLRGRLDMCGEMLDGLAAAKQVKIVDRA
jgi:hypothetical protein